MCEMLDAGYWMLDARRLMRNDFVSERPPVSRIQHLASPIPHPVSRVAHPTSRIHRRR
jgi:hypothetical protein